MKIVIMLLDHVLNNTNIYGLAKCGIDFIIGLGN